MIFRSEQRTRHNNISHFPSDKLAEALVKMKDWSKHPEEIAEGLWDEILSSEFRTLDLNSFFAEVVKVEEQRRKERIYPSGFAINACPNLQV